MSDLASIAQEIRDNKDIKTKDDVIGLVLARTNWITGLKFIAWIGERDFNRNDFLREIEHKE